MPRFSAIGCCGGTTRSSSTKLHERSLNIDFLLGYLKQILPRRPDLKLIITTATIDPQRFSRHFNDAPIIEVSGRTYPVEMRYRPLQSDDPEEEDIEQIDGIVHAVDELSQTGSGDVLVFLSGEREIREIGRGIADASSGIDGDSAAVCAIERRGADADFPAARSAANRAGDERGRDIADGAGDSVCDRSGLWRISRYASRSKVQRLPIEKISQASAEQRKGRCGRVAEGICIRLYSEEDFASRPRFTEPEILRTNLAAVILQMKSLGLGEVENFPFIEPPDAADSRWVCHAARNRRGE